MIPWPAIVFDLDDTLYPERDYVLSGFRAVAGWAETNLGIPAQEGLAELRCLFEQGVRGDTFDRWLAGHRLDSAGLVGQLVEVYRQHEPVLSPFPEVPGLLAGLRARHRLGLVSDGHLAVQQRKLAALELARYLDAIVFSDEWGRQAWKPSPRPFRAILERLRVEGPQAVYIGDNPLKDFWGARQAGMATIWVRRPEGVYSHLEPPSEQHAADEIVNSLAELEHH